MTEHLYNVIIYKEIHTSQLNISLVYPNISLVSRLLSVLYAEKKVKKLGEA